MGGDCYFVSERTSRIRHLHIEFRLLILARVPCSHLAGEDAWRDGIDADLDAGEGAREHAAQVYEAGFGAGVGELAG